MGQSFHRRPVYQNESEVGLMVDSTYDSRNVIRSEGQGAGLDSLDLLLAVIAEYEGLEYLIEVEKVTRIESYFVKKQLEINRSVDVTHIHLTVYNVFSEGEKRFRGSSLAEIHPGMTFGEMKEAIDEALYAAGFVRNEYYPLVEVCDAKETEGRGEHDLYSALEKLVQAVYAEDHHDKGYLSYSEFFIEKKDVRLLNSNGVDQTYTNYSTNVETAVNWVDGKEIEISEQYTMAGFDANLLGRRVAKLFDVASKKPLAQMTSAVKDINILLTGECLSQFFGYYYNNANAASVYNKVSTFSVGDALQGAASGDKISMRLDPFLEGSTGSKPYDKDGLPLDTVELIRDGVLCRYWGDVRNSSYLDISPTGSIGNYVVNGGTKPIAEMKARPYLELVSFSAFDVDNVTGDFASEIRLGFYFDGNETVAVTGGSVSGNIKKIHGNMRMSLERVQFNNYEGPLTVCVRGVAIAGQ